MGAKVGALTIDNRVEGLAAGVLAIERVEVAPASEELRSEIEGAIEAASARSGTETITRAVRDLLRYGTYKPTGRGKPASEYLTKAAVEGRFPSINNLVDINNLVSLESLLPISLLDVERAAVDEFVLRRGHPDESYVFNAGGQEIALRDLLLVARASDDRPFANPVKDSMETKLRPESSRVMAVLYGPRDLVDRVERAVESFGARVNAYGGPRVTVDARTITNP